METVKELPDYWVRYRKPTAEDADQYGAVWSYTPGIGIVKLTHYQFVKEGEPWMVTDRPEAYPKKERYTVKQCEDSTWSVLEERFDGQRFVARDLLNEDTANIVKAIYKEHQP